MHVAFDLDGVLLDSGSDLSWLDRALALSLIIHPGAGGHCNALYL